MPGVGDRRLPARQFQSAPGLEAGRCKVTSPDTLKDFEFQSAPGLEAGRCTPCRPARQRATRCFNPRPALRPGDATKTETKE